MFFFYWLIQGYERTPKRIITGTSLEARARVHLLTLAHKYKQMPLPFLFFLLLFDCVFIFVISAMPGSGCWHWKSWETGRVAGFRIADCIWWKKVKLQARCSDILLRQHFIANIVQFHFKRQSNFMWFLQAALLIVHQTFDFSSVSAGRFLVSFQSKKLDWNFFGFIFNVILLLSLFFHPKFFYKITSKVIPWLLENKCELFKFYIQ